MLMSFMKFSLMAFAVLGLQLSANAQSLPTHQTPTADAMARRADMGAKERINAWTVGLAVGSSKVPHFVLRQRSLAL